MDFEMDVDMDTELDPELAAMQRAAAELDARPSMAAEADNDQMNGVDGIEDGEFSQTELAATKVHIEGLSNMNTQDVENFARDHFNSDLFQRVEWVNDNSANLIYSTADAAQEALRTLAAAESVVEDPLELRPAKAPITHPDVELSIRQALVSDQKVKNAAAQSAYYLHHPEHDPETKFGRGRGIGRGRGRGRGGYGRRDRSRSTRSPTTEKPFDVNLYDDDPASLAARRPPDRPARRASVRSEEDLFANRESGRRSRKDPDLFADRPSGRLNDRTRSRSPDRDGDGRFGFSEDQPYRQTARRRSPPALHRRSDDENRLAKQNMKAELFPGKKSSALNGHRSKSPIDLFPKTVASVRQLRIGADREADERPRDLFARVESSQAGRLNADSSTGFSIKGAGAAAKNEISFLGASKGDLFPDKVRRRRGASDFM